jgi:hypothetical protein
LSVIFFLDMIIPDDREADHAILELLIERLRSGDLSKSDMRDIADMLDPKGRTTFQLKLGRRRGNRKQALQKLDPKHRKQVDGDWAERVLAFGEIYDALDGDEKKAIDQAELPTEDGGLGVSRTTAKTYLDAWRAHEKAQQEARDDE